MLHVTFVMEQHLGHETYYRNLRAVVESSPQLQPIWQPITYLNPISRWNQLKLLPESFRHTMIGWQQVQQALHTRPTDLFFFNTQVPAVLGGAWWHTSPYVISTDMTPVQYDQLGAYYGHQSDQRGIKKWLKFLTNRLTFRRAICLFPWSQWVERSLIQDYGVAPERIIIVPPGVDLQRWQAVSRTPSQPLRILFVGGDFRRKGGPVLLEAFRTLPAGSVHLSIVTQTPLAAEPGIDVYTDLQPNDPRLIQLYHQSDVFVLPTWADAFGIAAVEASAAGLPVIATHVGGLADVVKDGETGFLIPPGSVYDLHQRLIWLSDEQRRRAMGQAGRARAEHLFNVTTNVMRIVERLGQIMPQY